MKSLCESPSLYLRRCGDIINGKKTVALIKNTQKKARDHDGTIGTFRVSKEGERRLYHPLPLKDS